jgi:hypothetical protein
MGEPVTVDNYAQFRDITIQNDWAKNVKGAVLPTNVSFCHYAAPRYGGTGKKWWHTAATVASFALLAWGIYEQLRVFNMRYSIAKTYANLALEQFNRFKQRYMPLENLMIQAFMAMQEAKPDYEGARRRQTSYADWAWGQAEAEWTKLSRRFKVCPDRSNEWAVAKGLCKDDAVNFGYRETEHRAKKLFALRWNQRAELLNLGRGIQAIGARYAQVSNELLKPLGEGASRMTSTALGTIGYLYDHNMLSFPSFFTQSTTPGQMTGTEAVPLGKVGQ